MSTLTTCLQLKTVPACNLCVSPYNILMKHLLNIDSIQFTPENVTEELSILQCDKACGPDNLVNLPAQLLKVAAAFISLPLPHLF